MSASEKIIYVYDSFTFDEPKLLGKLYVAAIKGGENYSFEYDNKWLSSTNYPVSIDPDFFGYSGRQYPNGRAIFGIFADASPDRWGRLLMTKRSARSPIKKQENQDNWAIVIFLWVFMTRVVWVAFVSKRKKTVSFYPTVKKPPLRPGQHSET